MPIRNYIAAHAVPAFWRHYHQAAATAPHGGRLSAAVQRGFQAAFFAAVRELARYVRAQLHLVALIDGRRWHADAAEYVPTARCQEVIELLQACVLAQAPESCVIWGMPGAVAKAGIAAATLNPDAIALMLGAYLGGSKKS